MVEITTIAGTIGLGIMCKYPRPGQAKTRLGAKIGHGPATQLAGAFIRDVFAVARSLAADGRVTPYAVYRPAGSEDALRAYVGTDTPLLLQDEQDLGQAMFNALSQMLEYHPDGAIVIGSDFPTLPVGVVQRAVEMLSRPGQRVVFGPAEDGGFWLVGIKDRTVGPLFAPMVWGTSEVMATMRARCAALPVAISETDFWYDVDDVDGLCRLLCELEESDWAVARHTRAVAAGLDPLMIEAWRRSGKSPRGR